MNKGNLEMDTKETPSLAPTRLPGPARSCPDSLQNAIKKNAALRGSNASPLLLWHGIMNAGHNQSQRSAHRDSDCFSGYC